MTDTDQNDDAFAGLREALSDQMAATFEADDTEDTSDPFEEAAQETETVEAAAPVTEDAPAETADDEPDLSTAPALSYTVDGQNKTADFVKVYTEKDGTVRGAIVEAKDMPALQQRLSRADYYETQNKALYDKVRQIDTLEFKDGAGQQHKGMAAFDGVMAENEKLTSAVKLFSSWLEDPEKLIALAYATQQGDASEMKRLQRELGYAIKDAEIAVHTRRQAQQQTQARQIESTTEQQQQQQTTTQSIASAVDHWAGQFPQLTDEDKTAAKAYLSKVSSSIVRRASPEEARTAGVEPGSFVLDHPIVYDWLKDRAALRAAAATSAQTAQTTAAENAKRMASVVKGGKKGAAPAKQRQPVAATAPTDDWQQIKDSWSTGRFHGVGDSGE